MTRSFVWVLISVCIVAGVVHGQSECTVGTDADELSASRGHNFYLNTQDPAQCTGTVTQFQYCYYRATSLAASYDFTFAVYRSMDSSYVPVSQAFTTGRTVANGNLGLTGTFGCRSYSVDKITVQAGDVIGVCIYDPPDNADSVRILGRDYTNRVQIDMVGENAPSDRFLLSTGNSGCGDNSVPASVSSLGTLTSRVLHIYADITPLPTTEPPPTTSAPTMGTSPPVTTDTPLTTNTPQTETSTMPTSSPISTETTMNTVTTMPSTTSIDASPEMSTNSSTTITATESNSMATIPPSMPVNTGDGTSGVVAAVVVILLLIIAIAVVISVVIGLLVVRKRRSQKNLSLNNVVAKSDKINDGIDNAVYSQLNENSYNADYQEIDSVRSSSSPTNHYEVEHEYECEDALESYYAEVGPLLDLNNPVYETPKTSLTMSYKELLQKNQEEDIYGSVSAYQVPATQEEAIYAQLKTLGVRSISRSDVDITRHLGSGQFGSVEQGVWKRQGTKPVDVALKSLTKTSEEDRVKFLQEAAIMAQFKHPNVILLYGVITKGKPMMLVGELAKKGDLREFLLSIRPDPGQIMPGSTSRMLLKFSQQVALGMQYLSAKGFVHRDLAARNVLVTANNQCKVADFGMSRDLADENYYVSQGKDKIPVKWTAPEAIHYKKYSTASDVWAYGCLLYEIWSVGHKPFEANRNNEVLRLVDRGQRLAPPPGASKKIYELMILCWCPEKSQRPGFRDIVLTLIGDEEKILSIPEEDSSSHPLAGVLGATLEAGENMYTQLQNRYH